ncbi:biotin/lipoyl-containing protein, partial [Pseudoalteromonas undina]
ASMEVPAPFAGTVKEITVTEGDKVKTGALVFVFEVAGSSAPASDAPKQDSAPAEPAQSAEPSTKEVNVPDIGD